MKQRFLAALFGLSLLAVLAIGCSSGGSARGWAAPVRAGDTVVVSTGKGRLDGLNASTREAVWRFPRDWNIVEKSARGLDGIYSDPVLSRDGRTMFVGDYNGYLYAFRPSDLSPGSTEKPPAASLKLEGPVIGGVVFDTATDTLFVTSGKKVFSVRASDMETRITNRDAPVRVAELFVTEGEIWSAPVLGDGRLYVASLDGNLYAVNPTSGAELWRYVGGRALASSPSLAGGTVLIGGFDNRLHAVDASTGNEKWSFEANNWVWTRPAIDGNRVYIGDFDGYLHAINLSDGRLLWSERLGDDPVRAAPAVAGGVVVVATDGGSIYGIDASTQARRWGKTIDGSIDADLVVDGNAVLLAPTGCVTPEGGDSRVYYLRVDPQTGDLTQALGIC